MTSPIYLLSWLGLFAQASASLFNHHEASGMACAISAQSSFTTCNQEDYGCFCASNLFVYAVESCIGREANYNSTQMGLAFDKFDVNFCETHNSKANTTDVWSEENIKANPTVSAKAFKLAYEGEKNNASQKRQSAWLGSGMIFYWTSVIGVVTFWRLVKLTIVRLFAQRMVMRRATKFERFCQRYVFWPALFNSRHMARFEYFRGYVTFSSPTRFESILVSGYILLAVIFMSTPYTFMNNDPLFESRWKEMMRYSSDRSGIIATYQIPSLISFALRNNIILWMTGWSYSTFNTYHRAIARVTYLLLVIHAILKHIFSASYGGSLVKYYYPVPYFRWGCAAIGLFSLMIIMAIARSRGYEFFYRLHQMMAIGAIICSIFHLKGSGFKEPSWISFAFWGADWTIRFGRILIFNINFILPPLPGSHRTTFATARVYPSEMVRLTVTTPVRWICKPGQYVFLHTNRWTFIGGHPFSVLGASECGEGLELVIKARKGLTRRLHTLLDDRNCSPDYPITIPVYVEGPYGHSAPVQNYDEGSFFAGGIGITGVIGFIEKMLEANQKAPLPKVIRLFWSVRSKTDIEPIAARLAELNKHECIQIRIFARARGAVAAPDVRIDSANENYSIEKQGFIMPSILAVDPNSQTSSNLNSRDSSAEAVISRRSNTAKSRNRSSPHTHKHSLSVSEAESREGASNLTSSYRPRSFRRHTRNFSQEVTGFIDLVKSGNPEEDDEEDYGKGRFLEKHDHGNYSDTDEYSIETIVNSRRAEVDVDSADLVDSRRKRSTRFMAAGFGDVVTERQIPALDPFDDQVYPIAKDLTAKAFHIKQTIDSVYSLVEPVGMDIAHLIQHHFKHSHGSVCVLGCGPDRMMDTLCWSCCEFLDLVKNGRVDYYEESFRW